MSVACRLLALSLAIVTLMSSAGSGEARPADWIFTGRLEVQDPSANPVLNVSVSMQGSARYNIRQEWDPELGGYYGVWDTAFCEASGKTNSQGQVTLTCSIPWDQAVQANSQSLRISDSRYNVLERKELMRTAHTLSMSIVAAFEGMEMPLVQKFAPKLILTAGDQGVRPSPVEIMDRNGDGRLGWEDVLVQVYTIAGKSLGEFKLDEILFWGGDHWYSGVYQYPYLHYVMKYYIIPGVRIVGDAVVPDNPPGIYIMVPHFEWGHIAQTNGFDWYGSYQQVLQAHAGDSRYTQGTVYTNVFNPPGSNEVVIQYWLFYPFNFSGNRHEGDWEHINVVVDSGNVARARIVRVEYYYHHKVTVAYTPGVDFEVIDGTHPVVYVGGFTTDAPCSTLTGYGTHGSYPRPGRINNINPAGSHEMVGGDGLQIDFDGYRNIELLFKVSPRTVYAENPELTYTLGWQHFAAGWGYPLSHPLPCDHAPFLETIFSIIDKLPFVGRPFNEVAKLIIYDLFKVGQDLLLEDTNKAPVGPRYHDRWENTSP